MNALRVGLFLAIRYVRRSNVWATLLIVFIMLLTFLNVVVVRGILIGLPIGAVEVYNEQYSGDVLVESFPERSYIENSTYVSAVLESTEEVQAFSPRYISGGLVEANYKQSRKDSELADNVSAPITGIDPAMEDAVTGLAEQVVEGDYLDGDDLESVMIGSQLIDRYNLGPLGDESLEDVYPGTKIRISINGNTREFTVKGIVKTKIGDVSRRVYMLDQSARKMMGRFDYNVDEVAVRAKSGVSPENLKASLYASGLDEYALVETSRESQGQFTQDIEDTFEILGVIIGLIGLIVASITVFIVIFINAVSRQKQVGILTGSGVSSLSIELSYVFLSIFYAAIGVVLGTVVLYGVIMPYFLENPIDFPFSDGILVAPYLDTAVRSGLIVFATIVAGYIPASIIVKKNTMNAILGR